MTPFWGYDREISRWVAAQLNEDGFGRCIALGVMDEVGELVAGVVFYNWSPECLTIQLAAASTSARWMTRPVLWEMFSYAFDRAQCQLAVLRVSENNKSENDRGLHRLLPRYGFKSYRIPRLRGREEAEIIYTLADDDWRRNGFHRENRG